MSSVFALFVSLKYFAHSLFLPHWLLPCIPLSTSSYMLLILVFLSSLSLSLLFLCDLLSHTHTSLLLIPPPLSFYVPLFFLFFLLFLSFCFLLLFSVSLSFLLHFSLLLSPFSFFPLSPSHFLSFLSQVFIGFKKVFIRCKQLITVCCFIINTN